MIFKAAQIEKYCKKPDDNIHAFLVYGANDGLVNDYLKKLVQTVSQDLYDPFAVVYFNWAEVQSDIGNLFAEYSAQSLMGGKRAIVLKDADNNLTKQLKILLEKPNPDVLLIVTAANLTKKASLLSLAEERDDMAAVACYEDRDESIFSTAKNMFSENGLTINNEALQLLCSRLSNDRKINLSEIEKLITYMGSEKNVRLEDIRNCISDQSASSSDDVCYYAANGQTEKALKSFQKLIQEGNEAISVIRSLTYHFNKILTVKSYMEKGDALDKAVFKLVPKIIFFRESSFKRQVSIWPRERIFSVLELLYKAEKECKTTNMPVEEIVSYTLMQISSAAAKLSKVA